MRGFLFWKRRKKRNLGRQGVRSVQEEEEEEEEFLDKKEKEKEKRDREIEKEGKDKDSKKINWKEMVE